jgi:hypothetical protein
MGEHVFVRAAWAIGVSLLSWSAVFLARRTLHRRERTLRSPETARWQDDALAAVPFAWLFVAGEVLRAVLGREPPTVVHAVAGIVIAVALSVALRGFRRARPR